MSGGYVIGMDTSSYGFHWAATRSIGGSEYGWNRAEGDGQDRQVQVFWHARMFFSDCPPGAKIFCEAPAIMRQNIKTTMSLVAAAHTIWSAFVASKLDGAWFWVPITEWRKEILGRGNPPAGVQSKVWVEEETDANPAFQRFPFDHDDLLIQQDLREAWCLMVYGRRQLAR